MSFVYIPEPPQPLLVWFAYRVALDQIQNLPSGHVDGFSSACRQAGSPARQVHEYLLSWGGSAVRWVPLFRPWGMQAWGSEHTDAFAFGERYLCFAIDPFIVSGGWRVLGEAGCLFRGRRRLHAPGGLGQRAARSAAARI